MPSLRFGVRGWARKTKQHESAIIEASATKWCATAFSAQAVAWISV